MTANLRVLVVSTDRALLRQFSYLLDEFGYEAICYADPTLASRSAIHCDFLIVDHDSLAGDLTAIEYLKRRRDRDHLQVYLLHRDSAEIDIEAAVECGVDDFLRKPLSIGEILARLRAGARYCEFQRRNCRRQWHDPLTGLASRTALLEHLRRHLGAGRARNTTLALLEVDLFDSLVATRGRDIGNELLNNIARVAEAACIAGQIVAYMGEGKFAVMLPDHSLEKAAKWAEKLRLGIASPDEAAPDPQLRITTSVGLASGAESLSAEELLERASEALQDAHCCGRNCLAVHGEYASERSQWDDLVKTGNPFQSTFACDVMTPVTLTLTTDDSIANAREVFAQTRLDWLVVVDQVGTLQGVVEHDEITNSGGEFQTLGELMHQVAQLSASTPFRTVMDRLVHHDEEVLVVIDEGLPVGIVTREQLLALVRCVSADMFTTTPEQNPHDTDFLVVPDVVATV